MKRLTPFVADLRRLLRSNSVADADEITEALNGAAATFVKTYASHAQRRRRGVFLSPPHVAERVAERLLTDLHPESVVFDPACGAGDLLLAVLRLGTATTDWPGVSIRGTDIVPELATASRLRLELAHRHWGIATPRGFSRHFTAASTLTGHPWYAAATHIVMNPPFIPIQIPTRFDWSSGRVNAAAVFVATALANGNEGARITAVLPHVLRSGPRYSKWREHVGERSEVLMDESLGKFDVDVDVDVFLLDMRIKRAGPNTSLFPSRRVEPTTDRVVLGDKFHVSVGRVVEYRDPTTGREAPYLRARDLQVGGVAGTHIGKRLHPSRPMHGPLLVVRRTSSPAEATRVKPTVVEGRGPFFLDNHLIALEPRDGQLSTCRQWMEWLRSAEVTAWMNRRNRCRHLTVGDIERIPWRSFLANDEAGTPPSQPG